MIKVLILDTVMDRGGAETMIMNYYRNIDRKKIQFDFLVHRDYRAAYEDEIEKLGGKIYRICPPYPQNYFKYCRDFNKFLDTHPEYQIIHSNMMELGLFAYKVAKKRNIPIIICHSHTSEPRKYSLNFKSNVRNLYKKLILRYITHYFTCGKQAGISLYGKKNIDKFIIMPNAIDSKKFIYNKDTDNNIRKKFKIENKFVVGHVGRFFEAKNHFFIIDIFYSITKKCDDAVLLLVGGGELDNSRMNLIKNKAKNLGILDKIIFTGVVDNVNEIMQTFDVFILPSLQEGFPVVMVEAQAVGLKCIISNNVPSECDITGNVEILSLEDSADEWADHILNYKNSYSKTNMQKKIIEKNYDIVNNARWLENFYINELNKRNKK